MYRRSTVPAFCALIAAHPQRTAIEQSEITKRRPVIRSPPGCREIRELPGSARELEDMHPGLVAVGHIDEAAVVDLDVVRLDRSLAALAALRFDAARLGVRVRRRHEVADLLELVRVADVEHAHAGVESAHE